MDEISPLLEKLGKMAEEGKTWEIRGEIAKADGAISKNSLNELAKEYIELSGIMYVFKIINGRGSVKGNARIGTLRQIEHDGILLGSSASKVAGEILEILKRKHINNGALKEIGELEVKYKELVRNKERELKEKAAKEIRERKKSIS